MTISQKLMCHNVRLSIAINTNKTNLGLRDIFLVHPPLAQLPPNKIRPRHTLGKLGNPWKIQRHGIGIVTPCGYGIDGRGGGAFDETDGDGATRWKVACVFGQEGIYSLDGGCGGVEGAVGWGWWGAFAVRVDHDAVQLTRV